MAAAGDVLRQASTQAVLCFCSLLSLRPTVKKNMSKWSRETQENVPIGKAKSTYTLKAAKKGKCAGSSYNW